ncbi:DUF6279 family lipoprotein [Ferrimonas marina]|uniref:Lipoprotein n=1 Tax=Ferrimonas marina TaxID=299255 RepID=A0A1M5Z4T8_9GAMM|nr:DUF6279 family lipoprotein [Ferrimonas marina]SHI19201.1 hypothetical protein SAMN02745129_4640 [Ferrimonas marina]
MLRKVLIGVGLLLLTGCSTRFVYNWLDWIIPWQVDDYVTLNKAQEKQLDEMIDRNLGWHKAEELPRYMEHLEVLRQDVAEPMAPEHIQSHLDLSAAHWDRLFDQLLPQLVPFIQSFSDEQVAEIVAKAREEEEELHEKYADMTLEKRIKRSNKRMEKSVRKKIGKLTKEQKAIIHDYNENRHSTLDLWLSYREVWLDRFIAALENRQDGEALASELRVLMVEPDTLKSEQYMELIEDNQRRFTAGMAAIQQSMTPKQHRRLQRELGKMHDDFLYLAQR